MSRDSKPRSANARVDDFSRKTKPRQEAATDGGTSASGAASTSRVGSFSRPPQFEWPVSAAGYTLARRSDSTPKAEGETIYLVDPTLAAHRTYAPLVEYTGLFRTFAAVSPRQEQIVAFASQFGLLRGAQPIDVGGESDTAYGERLGDWVYEIELMDGAISLWEPVCAGDDAALARHIRWVDPATVVFEPTPGRPRGEVTPDMVIASMAKRRDLLWALRPGDVRTPALCRLHEMINRRLQTDVAADIQLQRHRPDRVETAPFKPSVVTPVPRNLRGALWLQLAEALAEHKQYRQCERCNTWFELTPKMAAKAKVHCSESCRMQAYRERQEHARRLAAEGQSAKMIARTVNTDLATVEGWLAPLAKSTRVVRARRPRKKR